MLNAIITAIKENFPKFAGTLILYLLLPLFWFIVQAMLWMLTDRRVPKSSQELIVYGVLLLASLPATLLFSSITKHLAKIVMKTYSSSYYLSRKANFVINLIVFLIIEICLFCSIIYLKALFWSGFQG